MISLIKNVLVFIFLYIPPLILFIKFWKEKKKSIILIVLLTLIYLVGSVFTQNLLPFILVIFNFGFLRQAYKKKHIEEQYSISNDLARDYIEVKFSINNELSEDYIGEKLSISNKLQEDYERFKFSLKKFNIYKAIKYFVFSYMMIILIAEVSMYILNKFNVQMKEQEVVTWMADMPIKRFIIIVPVIIIFAPIVEEFVFRWLFFEKIFTPRIGILLSAILSSLIFGMIHFNIKAFPILIWIGLYNCYLIHKKGYWYSVFNHFTFNFITTVALFFQKI